MIIWDAVNASRPLRSRGRAQPAVLPIRPQARHVLYGHSDAVACVALSPDLDVVVSASADGGMLFHTLSTGRWAPSTASHCSVQREAGQSWDCSAFFPTRRHASYPNCGLVCRISARQ